MNIRIGSIIAGLLIVSAIVFNSCQKNDAAPAAPVVAPAPVAHAHNNSPVGVGDTLYLYADYVAGAKYTWTGPGFSKTPNQSQINMQNPVLAGFDLTFMGQNGSSYGQYTVTTTIGGVTSQPYSTYITTMEITAAADSIGITNPTLPSTPNTFTTGTTLYLTASNVVDIKNQIIPVIYIWTGPNGFKSALQNPSLTVTTAAGGVYMVHDSIPATTNPYNKAHIGQTVSVTVITRLAAPIKLTANTPIVAGTLNLTCQPPASAGPNDNIFNWTGPNNFSATGQNVSIPNVTRAAVGNYFVTITNSVTRAISVPASIYANVNYSNSGCGGITHVYANGILYNLINIGNQCWFQTNLQIGSNPLLTWSQATAETTPTGIAPGQGACPTGYHLPTDSMLQSLAANSAVGFNSYNLDAKDANPCKNQFGVDTCANRNGNNSTGFSAQLSIALAADTAGIFWSVTDGGSPTTARMMQLVSDNNSITFTNALKTNTYNVRCLKD